MTEPRAQDKVVFRGQKMDRKTEAFLRSMESALGYELTVVQGCYSNAVSASGGTHAGGGVFDLAPYDWENKVHVGRELGAAIWHRRPAEGPWGEHIHGVIIGSGQLSDAAAEQVVQYRNRQNGLANHGPDTFAYHPDVPPFSYAVWLANQLDPAKALRKIKGLKAKRKALLEAISAAKAKRRRLKQKIAVIDASLPKEK